MPENISSNKFLAKFLKTILLVFFIVLLSLLIIFYNEYFKIKEIKIIDSKSNILGLSDLKNKNIFLISDKTIIDILKKKNPLIKNLELKKDYPNKIQIKISYYQPVAELIVNDGFFGLSNDGKILYKNKTQNKSLPKINFYQKIVSGEYQLGNRISFQEIISGLYFIDIFSNLNLKVNNLDINGINVLVFNLENKKIIISSNKDIKLQAFQMEEIVRQFKIAGKTYREIDLRYDKPVIRF